MITLGPADREAILEAEALLNAPQSLDQQATGAVACLIAAANKPEACFTGEYKQAVNKAKVVFQTLGDMRVGPVTAVIDEDKDFTRTEARLIWWCISGVRESLLPLLSVVPPEQAPAVMRAVLYFTDKTERARLGQHRGMQVLLLKALLCERYDYHHYAAAVKAGNTQQAKIEARRIMAELAQLEVADLAQFLAALNDVALIQALTEQTALQDAEVVEEALNYKPQGPNGQYRKSVNENTGDALAKTVNLLSQRASVLNSLEKLLDTENIDVVGFLTLYQDADHSTFIFEYLLTLTTERLLPLILALSRSNNLQAQAVVARLLGDLQENRQLIFIKDQLYTIPSEELTTLVEELAEETDAQSKTTLTTVLIAILTVSPKHLTTYGLKETDATHIAQHCTSYPNRDMAENTALAELCISLLGANSTGVNKAEDFDPVAFSVGISSTATAPTAEEHGVSFQLGALAVKYHANHIQPAAQTSPSTPATSSTPSDSPPNTPTRGRSASRYQQQPPPSLQHMIRIVLHQFAELAGKPLTKELKALRRAAFQCQLALEKAEADGTLTPNVEELLHAELAKAVRFTVLDMQPTLLVSPEATNGGTTPRSRRDTRSSNGVNPQDSCENSVSTDTFTSTGGKIDVLVCLYHQLDGRFLSDPEAPFAPLRPLLVNLRTTVRNTQAFQNWDKVTKNEGSLPNPTKALCDFLNMPYSATKHKNCTQVFAAAQALAHDSNTKERALLSADNPFADDRRQLAKESAAPFLGKLRKEGKLPKDVQMPTGPGVTYNHK